MKSIPYWSPDRYLAPEVPYNFNYSQKREEMKCRLLKKYFPKCIKKISMDPKNGPLKSKIKKTKVIHELQCPAIFTQRPYWRILLANKIKTFKNLYSFHQSPAQFAQKIKVLSGLKSIWLVQPGQMGPAQLPNPIADRYSKLAYGRLNRLTNLKFLSLIKISKNDKDLLEKINSFPRLLSSLTTFRLICDETRPSDPELLHIIRSQKNIISSMASLNLGPLCSPSHFESFKSLADSCPKLRSLRFEFSGRAIIHQMFQERKFAENTFPVGTNYLSTLKTFHNLKLLHLNIADTYTCLKDLTLPSLIQHLTLNFEEFLSQEIMLKIDPTFSNNNPNNISKVFEENETLIQFYENFRQLDHLETLKINFAPYSDLDTYRYQTSLLHALLKRIPTLQKFFHSSAIPYMGLNKYQTPQPRDPYLSQFLESCHSFSQTLQTLEIEQYQMSFSSVDLSASRSKFPQLSSIQIAGQFKSFDGLNSAILTLLEQLVLLGDSISEIKLLILTKNTVKSLLSLLQQISHFEMPTELYLEIEIKFFGSKDLEDLKEGFEGVINELMTTEQRVLKAKRTSLKIHTNIRSEEMKKFLNIFGERFEHFELCKIGFY